MNMQQLSNEYYESAMLIRMRIAELQECLHLETDDTVRQQLRQRIMALRPMMQDCMELSYLTGHYYDKKETTTHAFWYN